MTGLNITWTSTSMHKRYSDVMSIDEFGVQVMYAMRCHLEEARGENFDYEVTDVDIWEEGQSLFGDGWGGQKKNSVILSDFEYCPAVAMRLGRLAQSGHVDKIPTEDDYSIWRLTTTGKALLVRRGL